MRPQERSEQGGAVSDVHMNTCALITRLLAAPVPGDAVFDARARVRYAADFWQRVFAVISQLMRALSDLFGRVLCVNKLRCGSLAQGLRRSHASSLATHKSIV